MWKEKQIPPQILVTYYNTNKYLFERGYVAEEDFKRVGRDILYQLGYTQRTSDLMLEGIVARVRISKEVTNDHRRSHEE